MIYAYKETYLDDAMRNLGEMTEYAYYACNTDPNLALKQFVISGFAKRFEIGDPMVVCGMSGTELYMSILDKCGISKYDHPQPLVKYDTDEYYWLGYILAYFQWKSNRSFANIFDSLSADDFIRMYPALHTVSEDQAYDIIYERYSKKMQTTRLQVYRKRLGLTQKTLSDSSGVNLRTLQQYEIGSKELNKASVETVLALSKSLGCRPEDIL